MFGLQTTMGQHPFQFNQTRWQNPFQQSMQKQSWQNMGQRYGRRSNAPDFSALAGMGGPDDALLKQLQAPPDLPGLGGKDIWTLAKDENFMRNLKEAISGGGGMFHQPDERLLRLWQILQKYPDSNAYLDARLRLSTKNNLVPTMGGF